MPTTEKEKQRIGIFVCECGGNISDVIDVKAVINHAKKWKNTVVEGNRYLCSKPAQEKIIEVIKSNNLNRVVVAACTPRMHLQTFQSVLERAGLNPYMLEFVNIREQCSWVHGPRASENATRKAVSLIRGGYERSMELEPLEPISTKCSREILIVGGGIAGITAALELGNLGYKVHLVEKNPTIGGNMAKLTKVFPTLDCAQCILTPKMAEAARNPNIRILTNAEVKGISGYVGNFKVKVTVKPRFVKETCNGCDECVKVCPIEVPNEMDEHLGPRKAIYIPFPQAVPLVYNIDIDQCIQCYKCVEVCAPRAIDFSQKPTEVDLEVGAIILATGYQLYDANKLEVYGYGKYENVITMMELEKLTSGSGPTNGFVKRADGRDAQRIAIVLCAGSRDKNYIPYCSRICCMYSLKQAYVLKKMLGIDVTVYYIDIRATGKGYEELYWRCQEAGVVFIRGKVAEIYKNNKNDRLVVLAEDTLTGEMREEEYDMVALATPMVPSAGLRELAEKMRIAIGEDGFITEKHPKLDPVDSLGAGIFACGCTLSPKDIRDTVSDALGASAKAALLLKNDYITANPEKAYVIGERCNNCQICISTCPVNAITIAEGKAVINPFQCAGCGACVPICPQGAIDFKNSTKGQLFATLRGILAEKRAEEVRIVAFVEKSVAYAGIDFLGLDRVCYPENIFIVAVPTTAILGLKHLLYAFANGADGILIIEGSQEIDEKFMKKRALDLGREIAKYGIETMRVRYSYTPLPVYKKAAELFSIFADRIKKLGPIAEDKRSNIRQQLKT
ncbi:MAG: hydrogenase iron-sulfur subunit [Nitrososphaerota archaeon]|nr:hydrogenase iron-sulfur subunit [Candidatus Bathyarchaeota archaeon]MDW8023698.1 hydrogenase iron-sulfur subunit [Nitrososphaerota archaeon]